MTREEILRDKARYDEIAAYNAPIIEKAKTAIYDLKDRYIAKYNEVFGLDNERYGVDVETYFYGSKDDLVRIWRTDRGSDVSLRWDIRIKYDNKEDRVLFYSNSWSGANVASLEAIDDLVESASVIERILKYPDFKIDYLTIKFDMERIVREREEALKPYPDDLKRRDFERELKNLDHEQLTERLFNGEWYKLIKWDKYSDKERIEAVVRIRRHTEKTVWYDYATERTYWENNECVHTGEYRIWRSDVRCLKSNFTYAPNGKFESEFTDEEKKNYCYRYEAMPNDFKPVSRW